MIFAIEQAGFAVADNSSDRFIAELANRTPATDAAIAEIKAQGVDELSEWSLKANNGFGIDVTPEEIALFAASLRGEHEIKS
ncbi:Uncharacterised protein [Yersinia enterocolitica]|nr:Uncharacterised protein [Yersinia enterocolitica]